MPCTSPLVVYTGADGKPTFKKASSIDPQKIGDMPTLRCRKCTDCRLQHARDWSHRCHHEGRSHNSSLWATLTYAEDPGSISRRDTQLFFKKLRNRNHRFRYFGVGEYGEQFSRPHYHVCLFGVDPDRRLVGSHNGKPLYSAPDIEDSWPHGFVHLLEFEQGLAQYAARYTMKKITGDAAEKHYRREINGVEFDVTPEFQVQSTRPAIGREWFEKYWQDVFSNDRIVINGKEYQPPEQYLRWLKEICPRTHAEVSAKRRESAQTAERLSGERLHFVNRAKTLNHKNLAKATL